MRTLRLARPAHSGMARHSFGPCLAALAIAGVLGFGMAGAVAQEANPVPANPAPASPAPAHATSPSADPAPSVLPQVVAPQAVPQQAAAPSTGPAPSAAAPVVPAAGAAPDATQPAADPAATPAPDAAGEELAPSPIAGMALPHDLSPWGMFMAADIIVKAVMLGLAFASVVTWTIWLAKTLELAVAIGRLRRALKALLAAASLEAARRTVTGKAGAAAAMVRVTDLELERSADLPAEGIKERVAISLGRIEAGAGRRMTRGTGILATIGATAPFVGLFGTVWGIMNSFIGIAKTQTTNLAVVAPGIAEALLATAIGLVAAIPAVVIYNHFSRQVSGYRALLGDASAEMLRLLSRDLDRRDVARDARRERAVQAAGGQRVRAAAE